MAKFEAGEKCIFVGPPPGYGDAMRKTHLTRGEIVHVRRYAPEQKEWINDGEWYEIEEDRTNFFSEDCLRKLPPKHQPDDLRVAEPLFIQHQLPRLLGRKEKVSELEKQ